MSSLFGPSASGEQESSRPYQPRLLSESDCEFSLCSSPHSVSHPPEFELNASLPAQPMSKDIMDDAKLVGQKSIKSAEEEMDLREHFPEVWLFDSHRIG